MDARKKKVRKNVNVDARKSVNAAANDHVHWIRKTSCRDCHCGTTPLLFGAWNPIGCLKCHGGDHILGSTKCSSSGSGALWPTLRIVSFRRLAGEAVAGLSEQIKLVVNLWIMRWWTYAFLCPNISIVQFIYLQYIYICLHMYYQYIQIDTHVCVCACGLYMCAWL